jgi:radical SAM/Cys-rich protein
MMKSFQAVLDDRGLELVRRIPRSLQLNLGKRCNLTCAHCHVNAGPKRREVMDLATMDKIVAWQERAQIATIDLTGGAPEIVPSFRELVSRLRRTSPQASIIDRCNLTILLEPGFEDLPDFFVEHGIEIVASMPCYSPENVEAQRGEGVFDTSIKALQKLNQRGYGIAAGLPLHLVYNPNGAFLPGPQDELEAEYKRELRHSFGIEFNRLFALTNLPVARFASWLRHSGQYERYLELLVDAFNPAAVDGLMCRETINVSWRGEVFDCDFNQMLDLPMAATGPTRRYLWEVEPETLAGSPIRTGEHCFGCAAGAGSSCAGSLEAEARSR